MYPYVTHKNESDTKRHFPIQQSEDWLDGCLGMRPCVAETMLIRDLLESLALPHSWIPTSTSPYRGDLEERRRRARKRHEPSGLRRGKRAKALGTAFWIHAQCRSNSQRERRVAQRGMVVRMERRPLCSLSGLPRPGVPGPVIHHCARPVRLWPWNTFEFVAAPGLPGGPYLPRHFLPSLQVREIMPVGHNANQQNC